MMTGPRDIPARIAKGFPPEFSVWFFELPDDTVWGATARMLVELLRLVFEV